MFSFITSRFYILFNKYKFMNSHLKGTAIYWRVPCSINNGPFTVWSRINEISTLLAFICIKVEIEEIVWIKHFFKKDNIFQYCYQIKVERPTLRTPPFKHRMARELQWLSLSTIKWQRKTKGLQIDIFCRVWGPQ